MLTDNQSDESLVQVDQGPQGSPRHSSIEELSAQSDPLLQQRSIPIRTCAALHPRLAQLLQVSPGLQEFVP